MEHSKSTDRQKPLCCGECPTDGCAIPRMWLQQEDDVKEIELEVCDQYTIQGDLFSQAILNNTPVPTPLDDAVANMRVIEAVVESDREGGWVVL